MIGLIQRVNQASVAIDGQRVGAIDKGLVVLLGVEKGDSHANAQKLAEKISQLRIFNDENNKMNLNLLQVQGQLLIVSQFTLAADTRKGNRPGFSQAASPADSEILYQYFIHTCQSKGVHCESGQFGADMQVSLINDGPVTFHLQY